MVVVLCRFACDIGVLARGQVESLERAKLGEEVERAKNGRASDLQVPFLGLIKQIGCGEVAGPAVDELGHGAASTSHPMTSACEFNGE